MAEICQAPPDSFTFSKTCAYISNTLGKYPEIVPWHQLVLLNEDGSWGEIIAGTNQRRDLKQVEIADDIQYFSECVILSLRIEKENPFMQVVLGMSSHPQVQNFHILLHGILKAILARARVIEDRDEFISLASHEFKTPITAMKLRLEITRRKVELTPAMTACLETLEEQTNRLNGLVEELLDMTRIERGKLTYHFVKLRLEDLLSTVLNRFRLELEKSGNKIHLELEPNITVCWCGSRMDQVFSNLIVNSIKYAPGAEIFIKIGCEGESIRVIFEDKGPGIPKEKIGRIFNRFERAHSSLRESGLGLGLYIVREILKGHNGSITVESGDGGGTRFTMNLPKEVQ